ncbi:MAG TPA: hypothetical protein IAD15_04355 [Candidatus Fimiplasma intestinipullorum]|uniref:Uncharacterized protein n=1 Tax=Candidatus Fimiplasma intestinipullorum TaxID=2840825 RepID=A0A9D1HP15_9FIRM|nr:hypothetical protein [Candidatus Fimiplasma intestinipullorum]
MERPSRMSKYKELREGIKTDVSATSTSNHDTVKELNSLSDTDFLREFPQIDDEEPVKPAKLRSANKEDTLVESLTLDTINSQVDEELQRALTRVREDAGQDDFNTRMDILNKIRQSQAASSLQESFADDEEEEEEVAQEEEEVYEEEEDEDESPSRARFGLFRRHQDDEEEEEDEEYEEYDEYDDEEEEEESSDHRRFGFLKRHHDDEEEEEDDEEPTIRVAHIDEEEEEEDDAEHSKFVKVLNGIIVILVLILVGLLVYFASEFFL